MQVQHISSFSFSQFLFFGLSKVLVIELLTVSPLDLKECVFIK